jgi:hypothetical protein
MATATRTRAPSESSSYRRVAKHSQVDEALFGSKAAKASTTKSRHGAASNIKAGQMSSEVVALTKTELDRMLGKPSILSAAEVQALKQEAAETREKERATANARKARMLEMEEAKKKQVGC